MTTANDIYKTLADLNITLPPISVPAAAYVPYVQTGHLIFLSGNIAKKDGYASEQLDLAAKNATDYRAKSDSIESSPQRNDGKKELKETVKRNEAFSSIQSLKLRWFGVANGLLMFGFFLTFFGLFFKSRLAMTGSTAVSLLGTLVTINGFYLFV